MTIPVSRNPTNDDTLTGVFNEVLRDHLKITDDMLPARVISYDRTTNRATVQPLIRMLDTEGNEIERAPNSTLPVLLLGAGNFFISFHIPENSLGWIKANDRDTSIFLENHQGAAPNTLRMHSFEDALFIPDIMTGYTINSEDAQAMVIQSSNGLVRMSLNSNRIKLTAPRVEVDTPGTFAIKAASLTHNDVNIGNTHTHTQPPDSSGDVEQPTGTPQ